ncbi:MAG: Sec-independent protein translocase protein TatB [Myxococcota bacterium]
MLGLGVGEMVLIAAVALVVVGPERLPVVMRQLGRWYGQLRRAADDLRRAFVLEADRQDAADRYRQLQERRKVAQEARKRAQEQVGGAVQPDAEATAPSATEAAPAEGAVVANDIAPDSPHPGAHAHVSSGPGSTGPGSTGPGSTGPGERAIHEPATEIAETGGSR